MNLASCCVAFSLALASAPSSGLRYGFGTLIVVVLSKDEVAIATDSRVTTVGGTEPRIVDGQEKVHAVAPHVVFFGTGIDRIYDKSGRTSIGLVEVAERVGATNPGEDIQSLAHRFAEATERDIRRIVTPADLSVIAERVRVLGLPNMFEVTFAGMDPNGSMACLTVRCKWVDNQLRWDYELEVGRADQQVFFFGESQALREAVNNPSSPLGQQGIFRRWLAAYRGNRWLDGPTVAEALLALGIAYLPPSLRTHVGYPLYVYRMDSHGVRRLRVVPAGAACSLPPGD